MDAVDQAKEELARRVSRGEQLMAAKEDVANNYILLPQELRMMTELIEASMKDTRFK